VAVVIPCFNDGATVREAVESVRTQECELVVVDDGSDDPATVAELDQLSREGIRVVRIAHAGVAAARMAGVDATAAPFVVALDADDRFAPGAVTDLADALDRDPTAVAAWGDVQFFGATRRLRKHERSLDAWLITYQNRIPVMTMIRRDALLEVGGWRTGIAYEDWDLWMAFAERGWNGIRIPRVVAHYRVRSTARKWKADSRRHDELVAELKGRHPTLFAQRRRNWAKSRSPLRLRLLLPLIWLLPIREYDKLRLGIFARDPLEFSVALLRRGRDRLNIG
jgi:glycosyltransferase involved in cell wall biosynthesis